MMRHRPSAGHGNSYWSESGSHIEEVYRVDGGLDGEGG